MEREFWGKEQSADHSDTLCSDRKPEDVGALNSECPATVDSHLSALDETQLGQVSLVEHVLHFTNISQTIHAMRYQLQLIK